MIISRTPFRVSFFGGGTDYPAWYRKYGGAVLAATINKYCYLTCRYLPPFFEGCKFVIESIFAAIGKANTHVKYRDPNITEEARRANILKVQAELFGNETDIGDKLAYGEAVGFTTSKTLH